MASPGKGGNVRLGGPVNIWFDAQQPNQIHLTLNDEVLVHPETGKDGLHLVASADPRSTNFDPKTFNTLRSVLIEFGKAHPEVVADEAIPRRLDRRKQYID